MSASAAPPSNSDTDTLLQVHNNPVLQDSKVQDAGGECCSCMSNGTLAHVVDALSLATAVVMVVAVHMLREPGDAGLMYNLGATLLMVCAIIYITVAILGASGSICLKVANNKKWGRVLFGMQAILLTVAMFAIIVGVVLVMTFFNGISSDDAASVDEKYATFAGFANCTWNECCRLAQVRSRTYHELECPQLRFQINFVEVCRDLPRVHSNATACVTGDGTVQFRNHLAAWLQGYMMQFLPVVILAALISLFACLVYTSRAKVAAGAKAAQGKVN